MLSISPLVLNKWQSRKSTNRTEQVEMFQTILEEKMNMIFPMKNVKTSSWDKEYSKRGQSEKYKKLKIKFDQKYKKAAQKYILL